MKMEFREFCNICYKQESIIKICSEESEHTVNILTLLVGQEEIINEHLIYVCSWCCKKLEEINEFKEMCIKNFVNFRVSYKEFKRKLEIDNDSDMKNKVKLFINARISERNSFQEDPLNFTDEKCVNMNEDNKIFIKEEPVNNLKNENVFECDVQRHHDIFSKNLQEEKFHSEIDLGINYLDEGLAETKPDTFKINDLSVADSKSIKRNQNSNSYKCKLCISSFSEIVDLINHGIFHEKPYTCNICSKSFTQAGHLKRHNLSHTLKKKHKCNVCKKTFSQSGSLRRHELLHIKGKIYICNVCKQSFGMMKDLRAHRVIHTEKPHACNLCDKVFSKLSNLTQHSRIHTGEKPHKCSLCPQAFANISNLHRHKRIHTGTKPYKCHICTKAFADSRNLKIHVLLHTNDVLPTKNDNINFTN